MFPPCESLSTVASSKIWAPAFAALPPVPISMPASFEIKSAQLPLVALLLKSSDLTQVATELLLQFGPQGESPDFFENDPVVLDITPLDNPPLGELPELLAAMKTCRLMPVGIRGADGDVKDQAMQAGLIEVPAEVSRTRSEVPLASEAEPVREIVREIVSAATMVVDKPLRSGQKIYARGTDLVVLAMVNQGAEVVADGNIHVYAPLRGKAMAGAQGNVNARIFSLCLEPELISIAGVYRTSENPLPANVQGKAAQVRLSTDGQEKLVIEALKA